MRDAAGELFHVGSFGRTTWNAERTAALLRQNRWICRVVREEAVRFSGDSAVVCKLRRNVTGISADNRAQRFGHKLVMEKACAQADNRLAIILRIPRQTDTRRPLMFVIWHRSIVRAAKISFD